MYLFIFSETICSHLFQPFNIFLAAASILWPIVIVLCNSPSVLQCTFVDIILLLCLFTFGAYGPAGFKSQSSNPRCIPTFTLHYSIHFFFLLLFIFNLLDNTMTCGKSHCSRASSSRGTPQKCATKSAKHAKSLRKTKQAKLAPTVTALRVESHHPSQLVCCRDHQSKYTKKLHGGGLTVLK